MNRIHDLRRNRRSCNEVKYSNNSNPRPLRWWYINWDPRIALFFFPPLLLVCMRITSISSRSLWQKRKGRKRADPGVNGYWKLLLRISCQGHLQQRRRVGSNLCKSCNLPGETWLKRKQICIVLLRQFSWSSANVWRKCAGQIRKNRLI